MSRPCQCLAFEIGVVPGLCPSHGRGQGPPEAEGEATPGNAPTATQTRTVRTFHGQGGPVTERATPRKDATAPPRSRVRPRLTSPEVPHDP
jgi:hypothetical protein